MTERRRGRCGGACEAAEQRTVSLQAQERRLGGSAPVTDINDNAPIFPAARKNLSLSENSPTGSRFPLEGASDADIGANAQLSYTLSPSEHFRIEEEDSNSRSKSLFLLLTRSSPSLTGTMELVISVLDVNDNAPQFNQSVYNVVLPEDALQRTLVARVNATDPDLGIYGEVIYEIDTVVPPSASDVFSIDANSGEIRLTGELDFETFNLYDLNVKAKDKGTPPLLGRCKVVLEVLDVNDNAPEVWVTSLSVPVPEDASVGTVVALLSVSDRDSGANGRVRCWVWPASPFGLEATFAGSYSLVLREALDRERTIPVHRLMLTASDGGRPSLTGTMELMILVLDVNDNAPQFNQSVYNVRLPEDALQMTLVARVNATDPDLGIYGEMIYEIDSVVPPSATDLFSIDANTGEIRLMGPLDFETVTLYDLHIKVTDKGTPPLPGHCKVVLEVLDVNDNAPEVWVTSLSVPVPEDASVGTVVALLSVSDRDSGANGRVRCWVWPASPFGLEATFAGSYSLVLREALDRERVSEYEGRSLCVADGAGKSDLMVFSPNFPPPPPGPAAKDTQPEPSALLDTVSGPPLLVSHPYPTLLFRQVCRLCGNPGSAPTARER
ncbi:PREDICTED: LOW QUALITY PROTEIN: protocadherin alpha-1 [Corvus brachyrhynchos]|uniref:LOW QUALITY PROTEIN: protocadherin alpha-1 n=1 Tax=Corvus brachyrhynchos TaxID=85066 RepID=UPI0008167A27|nr:PREDICTED: LOW QUALITY PROTEIN: protocadherin alpha-1 [Corvus brachyrhynchos]